MKEPLPEGVTQKLVAWGSGDQHALEELMPLVYRELRRLAHGQLRGERPDHTLQTTALVHEAYLRLVDQREANWKNRAQFFAVAAQMMRRILGGLRPGTPIWRTRVVALSRWSWMRP